MIEQVYSIRHSALIIQSLNTSVSAEGCDHSSTFQENQCVGDFVEKSPRIFKPSFGSIDQAAGAV